MQRIFQYRYIVTSSPIYEFKNPILILTATDREFFFPASRVLTFFFFFLKNEREKKKSRIEFNKIDDNVVDVYDMPARWERCRHCLTQ